MAKISPVSIKYLIHASFRVEGALEKPDIIGALFGQTEGLLGSDLEMRELQKEGKIGRIEVDLERKNKITSGIIKIPTALDQSETTLIAAAIETIEKIGPCDSQVEVENIEDVRGAKRDYILQRAKKLMSNLSGRDSREISQEIKDSTRTSAIQEYGEEKLPCGDLSGKEIIVVEGRADVLNLLKAGVSNVIAMNGTKFPNSIKALSEEKDIVLFVDGDRGGKLIIQNVIDNARVKYVCIAPDGKEVEELASKEVLMTLRKKMTVDEYLSKVKSMEKGYSRNFFRERNSEKGAESPSSSKSGLLSDVEKKKLQEKTEKNKKTKKAILLDENFNELKNISTRALTVTLKKSRDKPAFVIIDGAATSSVINAAEDAGVRAISANNFSTTDTSLELFSF